MNQNATQQEQLFPKNVQTLSPDTPNSPPDFFLLNNWRPEQVIIDLLETIRDSVNEATDWKKRCHAMVNKYGVFLENSWPDGNDYPYCPHFASEEFTKAWGEWVLYRRGVKKKPLKPFTIKRQLNLLSTMSTADAIQSINRSMDCQWDGLFPVKKGGSVKASQMAGRMQHAGKTMKETEVPQEW